MVQQFLFWSASHQICTVEKCLARGGGDLWRSDKLVSAMPMIRVRAEGSWMTCWRSNPRPVSELRNQCTFPEMEASAPFVSAGLGAVEAGPPEEFPVAEVLGNNNLQCVINEHRDLGPREIQNNIRALGAMFPGSWHCILISSRVEQSQNYAFVSEYFFMSLPQNEGSKVPNVKVQKIARLWNSFPEN